MSANSDRLLKAAHYITDPFGYRKNPVTGKEEFHNGTDYGTHGKKVPCYAVYDGVVERISKDRYGANFVYVKFPELERFGLYYHLDSVSVRVGQKVTRETQIGITGQTGQTTGIHLHFSWIVANAKAMEYYNADYLNYEKYVFPDEHHSEDYKKVQERYGFENATMDYLERYKFADDLFRKMLLPSNEQTYQLNTINYINNYRFGKEIFQKLEGI